MFRLHGPIEQGSLFGGLKHHLFGPGKVSMRCVPFLQDTLGLGYPFWEDGFRVPLFEDAVF